MSQEEEQLKECRPAMTPGGQQKMVVGVQEEEWEGEKAAPLFFSCLRIHSSAVPTRRNSISPTRLM